MTCTTNTILYLWWLQRSSWQRTCQNTYQHAQRKSCCSVISRYNRNELHMDIFIKPCTLIISCSFTDIMFGLRFRLQTHGSNDSNKYTTVETVYLYFTDTTCYQSDRECCFKISSFNGGPRKFFRIDGCVLYFTTSGPLSECPWTIPTCPLEMSYSHQPQFFFTKFFTSVL